jgi:recombination protein RecA
VKNKVAPPFKQAEFDIMYGEGISKLGDLVDCAVAENIIDKAGSWYSFDGERIGQGRENVKAFLKENPAMAEKIRKLFSDKLEQSRAAANEPEVPTASEAPLNVDEDGVVIE